MTDDRPTSLPAKRLSKLLSDLDFPKVSIGLDDDVLSIEPAIDSDGATAIQINGYDVAYLERRTDGAWNLRVVAWQTDEDFTITPNVVIHVPRDDDCDHYHNLANQYHTTNCDWPLGEAE